MSKVNYRRLKEIFESASVDNEKFRVNYSMMDISDSSVFVTEEKTELVKIRGLCDVLIKTSGEHVTFPFDVVKVPHYSSSGYIINGKNKQIIDLYEKAKGWYVIEGAKAGEVMLSLTPDRGSHLRFEVSNLILYVKQKEGAKVPKVPVSIFLKALTGKSFEELRQDIGVRNEYVDATFTIEEPTRVRCVDEVIKNLENMFINYTKGEPAVIGLSDKIQRIMMTLQSPGRFYLGDAVFSRFIQSMSFSMRCRGAVLAQAITVNGIDYFEGTQLSSKLLEDLDYSEIESIRVYLPSNPMKIFNVRKKVSYNFRVVGKTLAEDVNISNNVGSSTILPAGTVLTVPQIKLIEATNRESLAIYDGDVPRIIRRKEFSNTFAVDDFISMLQVYLDVLNGLGGLDDTNSLTNQVVHSVESLAKQECLAQIKIINREIENHISSLEKDRGQSLIDSILKLKGGDEDKIMNIIMSSDNKQSQTADLNNSVHKISQEHRLNKDVAKASPDMIAVQDDQFGRLDPVESPESSKIGTVHNRAFYSKTGASGFVCAPYIQVLNGEFDPKAEPIYLDAVEERGIYIAEWNETFHYNDPVTGEKRKKPKVRVRSGSKIMEVPTSEVFYKEYSPYQTMGPARMQIPFQEHSNPKRLLMGSNHQKQTVITLKNERPIVSSGGDSLVCEGYSLGRDILGSYFDSNLLLNFDREVFVNKSLRLLNTALNQSDKTLFFEVVENPEIKFQYTIPFMHKSGGGKTVYGYRINGTTACVYGPDDVVVYSRDVDIRKYSLEKFTDLGGIPEDPAVFDKAIALARNLVVAYKTSGSSTIDDAIAINGDLVNSDALTSIALYSVEKEIEPEIISGGTVRKQTKFGLTSEASNSAAGKLLGSDGMPKVGTKIGPNDPVIGYIVRETSLTNKDSIGKISQEYSRYKGNEPGQVVASYIDNNKAVILIASMKFIEEGDKMAGRYGNKGVIARIVPREQMPFDPVTGLIPDIILNPLGVPSRSNLSQLLEVTLGLAMKKMGKIAIVTPYRGNNLEFVRQIAEDQDVHPVMLRDGITGLMYERPVNVGVIYMLKLEHMVSHKINGVSLESDRDQIYFHPKDGQAFGEMETWCLMSAGATKVLQDIMSIHSDDLSVVSDLTQLDDGDPESLSDEILGLALDGENSNDQIFKVILRCLGTEPVYKDGKFGLLPLTDKDVIAIGNKIPANKGHLRSPTVFGMSRSLDYRESPASRDRWAYIELGARIVHPIWIQKGRICEYLLVRYEDPQTGKLKESHISFHDLQSLAMCRAKLELSGDEQVPIFRRPKKKDGGSNNEPVISGLTGFSAIEYLMETFDYDRVINWYKNRRRNYENNTSDSALKNIHSIDLVIAALTNLRENGVQMTDFLISTLPIMPLAFRPEPFAENQVQDFDYYYQHILSAVENYSKDRASRKPTDLEKADVYEKIAHFCGWKIKPANGGRTKVEFDKKPLLQYFSQRASGSNKKKAAIREHVLKKTVCFSGRTVIVPASDIRRKPTEVGLPFLLCVKIFSFQIETLLLGLYGAGYGIRKGTFKKILEVIATNRSSFDKIVTNSSSLQRLAIDNGASLGDMSSLCDKVYDIMYKAIKTFIEGSEDGSIKPRTVLVGRQPSLHEFSIRAFSPYIVQGKAIHIHPLLCKGYNADFDGDQMWVLGLVTEEAAAEALEKLSPKYGVINPKDNSVILSPEQDVKLGIYFATILKDNVTSVAEHEYYSMENIKYYSNINVLNIDLDIGMLKPYDLVCFTYNGRRYLSTAGRILFNSLLPDYAGFTGKPFKDVLNLRNTLFPDQNMFKPELYSELMFDGVVSGKPGRRDGMVYVTLSDVTKWSYFNLDSDQNIEVFQSITEFGIRFSHVSGISIGIEDLVSSPKIQENVDTVKRMFDHGDELYLIGVMNDSDRREAIETSFDACMSVSREQFVKALPRNNNLFIMYDSNARGDEKQIMQACGMIGLLQKTKSEVLETPVLSNYAQGNSSFDSLLLSYSTRTGVASTQRETAVSGELTRLAVFMTSGFKVLEDDCGAPYEPLQIMYKKFSNKVILPDGTETSDEKGLLGKRLADPQSREYKVALGTLEDGRVTRDTIEKFARAKVLRVNSEEGVIKLKYGIDLLSESLLRNRVTSDTNLPGLRTGFVEGNYVHIITDETVKYISENMIDSVNVRMILGCRTSKGVCATCFGMRYERPHFPNVGDYIGIQAAQSIGEPAAQLVLSLFHKGGTAGESVSGGVEIIKNVMNSGHSKYVKECVVSPVSGYFNLEKSERLGYLVIDTEDGKQHKINVSPEALVVMDGDYVEPGTPLTGGLILPQELSYNPSLSEIRSQQMALLMLYFRTFEASDIKLNARHFEIFARIQTSAASVIDSEDPNFISGRTYDLAELLAVPEEERKFKILLKANNSFEVMSHYGGSVLTLAHEDFGNRLADIVGCQTVTTGKSMIADLFIGKDVTGKKEKVIAKNPITTTNRMTKRDGTSHLLSDSELSLGHSLSESPANLGGLFDMSVFYGGNESVDIPAENAGLGYINLDELNTEDLLKDFAIESMKPEDPEAKEDKEEAESVSPNVAMDHAPSTSDKKSPFDSETKDRKGLEGMSAF